MKQLVIEYDPETRFCELYHPYNKRFVTYVSQGVKPLSMRRFDAESRRWSIHVNKTPQIVSVAKHYFEHVDYRSVPPDIQIKIVQFAEKSGDPMQLSTSKRKTPYEVLFVTTDAPPEVIKAAYRALASKYHPDHGGDEDKFKKVDEAWKKLKP